LVTLVLAMTVALGAVEDADAAPMINVIEVLIRILEVVAILA